MKKSLLLLPILFFALFPPFARAEGRTGIARVGVFDAHCRQDHHDSLKSHFHAIGYIEGANLELVNNCDKKKPMERPERAADMVRLKPDVIVARSGSGIRAVKRATRTIPIVMVSSGDPVASGFVASFARPGGNLTGVSRVATDHVVRSLRVLKEAIPEISHVALLKWHTSRYPEEIRMLAKTLGIEFDVFNIENFDDLDEIFRSMENQQVDGVVVRSNSMMRLGHGRIEPLAMKHRLPAIYPDATWVRRGGLMSYGMEFYKLYKWAVIQVVKIIKGARPGDIPIERITQGRLVINLKTAKKLGIEMSPETLMFADQVIE